MNADSNNTTGMPTIRMQIRNFPTRFEVFECKFEQFERDSNHSNANSKHLSFEAIESKFEPFEKDSNHSNANSNHSNEIQSNRMQIRTIQKEF